MAIDYNIDLRSIELEWIVRAGWQRRMARVTFSVDGNHPDLLGFEIPILLDAHVEPDTDLAPRAWARLHERLAMLQAAATKGENLSKTAVQRDLREG